MTVFNSSRSFQVFLRALIFVMSLVPVFSEAVEPQRVVATGGRIGYTFYTPAAGNTSFWHRTPHKLGGPVSEIQVGFMDWMWLSSGNETANTSNDVTITAAWLERASTGQAVPLTFSGVRQLVLPMNSTSPYWLCDAIPSSTWTGSAPARDEVFWLHAKGTIPEGGKIPTGGPANYSGGTDSSLKAKFIVYPPANDPGSVNFAGGVPTIAGSAARTEGLPIVFLGRFTGPGHLAVIGIGDSILHGSGDSTTAAITGYGFFNRAALDSNGANTIAMFNLTRHGQTASAFVNQPRQARFLPFANVVVEEFGTNDIGQSGTGNVATLVTKLETIWAAARTAGVQKIIRTQLMPRSASTDGWATLGSQTPNTGWEIGGKRDSLNASLKTGLDNGKIDILIDTLAVVGDPSDSSSWRTNGTKNYTSSDGTHVSPSGNALLAAPLRQALLSLTVDPPAETSYLKWSNGIEWNGADSAALADPNHDGVANLLCHAFGISPLTAAPAGKLPAASMIDESGQRWLSFSYREIAAPHDLTYQLVSSRDLSSWASVVPNGTSIIREIVDPNPDGDAKSSLVRVKINAAAYPDVLFVRLRVTI
jgi:lysophospholipase L1-like esterase